MNKKNVMNSRQRKAHNPTLEKRTWSAFFHFLKIESGAGRFFLIKPVHPAHFQHKKEKLPLIELRASLLFMT
jgi:hypothetical protein